MFDYFRKFSSRLKVYLICSLSDELDLHARSQLRLKVDKCFNLYFNSNISDNISAMAFKLGMKVDLCMGYILMVMSMTLTLIQGHSGSAEGKIQLWIISQNQKQKWLLAFKKTNKKWWGKDRFLISTRQNNVQIFWHTLPLTKRQRDKHILNTKRSKHLICSMSLLKIAVEKFPPS